MNPVPELHDLMPVTCAICGADHLQATLGKRQANKFYLRLTCPEHGAMLQFRLHTGEMQQWARTIIAQAN